MYEKSYTPKFLETGFCVCKDCDSAGVDVCGTPFQELLISTLADADRKVVALIDQWKTWSKERSEKIAAGTYSPESH